MKPLYEQLNSDGVAIFYDPEFRKVIEAHIPYMRNMATQFPLKLTDSDANRYDGDFYGLLVKLGSVPAYLHWITLRLNGMTSPHEYTRDMKILLVPDPNFIQKLQDIETTQSQIL